jgi:hypothetical protein
MKELVRSKIQRAVNKIFRSDSNIAPELLETYKDSLVNSVCDIFAALADTYGSEEDMQNRIEEFINENFKDKQKINPKGYNTDSYMVALIPILLPIEAVAMIDSMDDYTFPLLMSQLSGWLLRSIIELREYDKLSNSFEDNEKLAGILKEKGWVA